jgi:hypothetical protein
MTISSAVPDVDAVARELLGATPRSVRPVGAGRNSRVFKVDLDGRTVVVKFYRRDAGDTRDRLATEFGALRFLWDNGVRVVPRAIADDRSHYCAIYEFIEGQPPRDIGAGDIDAFVDFLASLQTLRAKAAGAAIGVASESSFSLAAVVDHVKARATRLRSAAGVELAQWFGEFDRLFAQVESWCRSTARRLEQAFDADIGAARRALSPSDFGFHNAIRRPDGSLAFVDFEYFGWDDPAKTVVDFLLHPGMALPDALKKRFADRFLEGFAFVPGLADRARLVYPLYGLKWCLILLNDFLPDRATTATADVRAQQLQKASALVDRLRREYRENPFV